MWLRQALVAQAALPSATPAAAVFYRGKLQTCQFFFRQELPVVERDLRVLESLDDSAFAMAPEQF
jgi:butyryl-CoA dehydrogenase